MSADPAALKAVEDARAEVARVTLALRAGDGLLAQGLVRQALRALNTATDALRHDGSADKP